jgi:multiple antibiotic resistance protein
MTLLAATVLLFLVMDAFGNVPVFLSVLAPVAPERRRRVIARELLFALAFLLGFLFAGRFLLDAIGLTEDALTIAGGIILFLIALKMVFPPPGGAWAVDMEEGGEEPFLVPLAVPFIAGPSVLASVLFVMSSDPARWPEWLAAVLARVLKRRGLVAIERLMGMVLTAIATKMVLDGVGSFFGL